MKRKTTDELYRMIQESPDREIIEKNLKLVFGDNDIRKIDHQNIETFIEDVLPRISPSTFGGGVKFDRR